MSSEEHHPQQSPARWAAGVACWALAWLAMTLLERRVDLANLAMLLVLASAISALWWPFAASMGVTAGSVLAFNWLFVPPKYTLSVDFGQDALLLGAMLVVGWIVAALVARQRVLAARARRWAEQAEQLRQLGDALRDTAQPTQQAGVLQAELQRLLGRKVRLLMLSEDMPQGDDLRAAVVLGEPGAHALSGLWQCARQGVPFGPGTGRHEELPEWYFPMRGRKAAFGAAMIELDSAHPAEPVLRLQAQALCDQMGIVLQHAQSQRAADAARQQAQAQQVQNAMLAAVSHDYRTPLAAIMGAASSLCEQGERLSHEQRARLARSIVDETTQLRRLTDNTLQLARLDSPGVSLRVDWESPEEIVGAVLARVRPHDAERRVRGRVEPALPLLRCDAMLMAQMLENLIDNALKYSEPPAPVEVVVRRQGEHIVFAVRDRGPGVAPAWRQRIFEVFQRGQTQPSAPDRAVRGAGVGLAVCRAIARAHGGELRLRPRGHGGASFECWLALPAPAEGPPAQDASQPHGGPVPPQTGAVGATVVP